MYQTYRFVAEVDAPSGWRDRSIASAIRRAVEYARENDISGTDMLDSAITRVDVAVCNRPVMAVSAAQQMLESILGELEDMGVGDDEDINGADAVDYLNTLKQGIQRFLKVEPEMKAGLPDGPPTTRLPESQANCAPSIHVECSSEQSGHGSASLLQEEVHVVVGIDGGVVQGGSANRPNVRITVVDYDTEGADAGDLATVPQIDQDVTCDAYVSSFDAGLNPEWVERVKNLRPHRHG